MTRAITAFSPKPLAAGFVSAGLALLAACGSPVGLTPPADIPGGDIASPLEETGPTPETPRQAQPAEALREAPLLPPPSRRGEEPAQPDLRPSPPPVRQASVLRSGPIQFLPVVGAPPEKVEILSEALVASAVRNGVAIMPSDGAAAPLRLKGYLSAMNEGSGTLVVYVWDVVDPAGNRVSRIQGQQTIADTAGDPWSVVGREAMAEIAEKTIQEFQRSASPSG